MPQTSNNLHLPDLSIKNFRGIKDLSINQLGRVTLIAGKNGMRKTTLLEAVNTYAKGGDFSILKKIMRNHDEIFNDDRESYEINWRSLFYNRHNKERSDISIGSSKNNQLTIKIDSLGKEEASNLGIDYPKETLREKLDFLITEFKNNKKGIPVDISFDSRYRRNRYLWDEEPESSDGHNTCPCQFVGPNTLNSVQVTRLWDDVVLTNNEEHTTNALQLIYGDKIDRIAVIGDSEFSRIYYNKRRVMVKVKDQDKPVPLKSLGDGAIRLFGIALALANSRDGFLLIDEVENGIHYSIQYDFWKMVIESAQKNNVQVLATTHGWSCLTGFAQAAMEFEDEKNTLIRLEEKNNQLHTVKYSKEQLKTASIQGTEVR